ncbi:hypothetical protein OF829_12585 [Sphingomonas sp. LB-2]|uniref:hypothetical protein n=1 Tax=Sphingomonas caeni TaxID=2984949 RepID=UPI002232BDDD|nr:hypothetical protein [Sphingomonas caeni]MCW3848079.1 hypothetical protein [Sphingomonas caeni]
MAEISHLTSVWRIEQPSAVGRLGLILIDDSAGDAIALTAAQITRGADLVIHKGGLVGACSTDNDRSWNHFDERPAWTMIEAVRIDHSAVLADPSVRLAGDRRTPGFGLCRDPHSLAGSRVLVHGGQSGPRLGILRSVRGLFRMPVQDFAEPVIFYDALVVNSLDAAPLSVEGDSGAAVTDLDGNAVGVVICGIGTTTYAAPIGAFLRGDVELRSATLGDIDLWNADAHSYEYDETAAPDADTEVREPADAEKRNWLATDGSDEDLARAGKELAAECL